MSCENYNLVLLNMFFVLAALCVLRTASAIQCYECLGGQCTSFSAAKLVTCPNNNDWCSSFGTYIRNNKSIPWNPATHLVNARLECIREKDKNAGTCDITTATMGKCWVSTSGTELNCGNCCEGDSCNNYVTDWNTKDTEDSSSLNVKASIILVFIGILVVLWI